MKLLDDKFKGYQLLPDEVSSIYVRVKGRS